MMLNLGLLPSIQYNFLKPHKKKKYIFKDLFETNLKQKVYI